MKQLGSLHKLSVSFVFILISLNASGSEYYHLSAGAGEAGAGNLCITKPGFWSSFHNQALLAQNNSFLFAINYNNRFNISQLGTRSAGMIIPSGKTSLGIVYSDFGYADFKRSMTGLACGIKLSEKLSAGAQVDYFAELTPGEYDDIHLVTGEAGIAYSLNENTSIAIHIFNPVPASIRKNKMETTLTAGAGTRLNNTLFAGAEAVMSTGGNINIKMGFEYEIFKKFWLRSGFSTEHNSFSFGFGYLLKFVKMDLAFSSHDKLGITSSASLIFKIR